MGGLPQWQGDAACAGISSESYDLFFPDPREPGYEKKLAKAKAVCESCPVVWDCLKYAANMPGVTGVWGGQLFQIGPRGRTKQRDLAAHAVAKAHRLEAEEARVVALRKRPGVEQLEVARAMYEEAVVAGRTRSSRPRRPLPPR